MRVLTSLIVGLYPVFVIWAGGSDFERGSFGLVVASMLAPALFGVTYTAPYWWIKES